VLSAARNPVSILTKSTLILRDLDLLVAAAARTDVAVSFSVGTLDRQVWKLTEPGTPPPDRRVEALRRLTDAGVSCGVLVAPVLPGLSDRAEQLEEVVAACAEAGAVSIHGVALHLRGPMRAHYFEWLAGVRPDLSALYRSRFARGPYQDSTERDRIDTIVRTAALRHGVGGRNRYSHREPAVNPSPAATAVAAPPSVDQQLSML
jgi:DNA repair photolyase